MRGVSFNIPNEYGQYLFDILQSIDIKKYFWQTGGEEAYYISDNHLGKPLFPESYVYTGEELHRRITAQDYYVIFADLKAFSQRSNVKKIATYEDFLNSHCEFVLLIVDCSHVTIYAKDQQALARIFTKAIAANYTNVTYITDKNDPNTTLIVF